MTAKITAQQRSSPTRLTIRYSGSGQAPTIFAVVMAAAAAWFTVAVAYSPPVLANTILASQALSKRASPAPRSVAPARTLLSRGAAPLVTVSKTGPNQAGYIHYYVITGPDGEPETQVGIELPGDRIAWSFPDIGVEISPFVSSGQIVAGGKSYEIEHLYGIRPFPDDESMSTLRRHLDSRVNWWLDQKTPYCDEERPSSRLCLSCLGFVLRVLFPGTSPALPALPADFHSARRNLYTTEDLLLYLTGVPVDAAPPIKLTRIDSLAVPEILREQLVRIASEPAAHTVTPTAEAPRPAVAKPRATGRSMGLHSKRGARRGS